jgi:hypothetical protein
MNTPKKKAVNSWIKVGVTAAILLGSAAIVGSGAFAVWTSSATANAAVNAGAIKISLVDSNITASGMAPGDTIQELLPISFAQATNSGDLVTAMNFSVAASNQLAGVNPSAANTAGANDGTGSSLFTGSVAAPAATNFDGSAFTAVSAGSSALTFSIDTCSVQWVKVAPATAYSCAGTTTSTVAGGSVLNSIQHTSPLTLTPSQFGQTGTTFASSNGDVNLYSLVSVTLPATANNSFTNAGVKLAFNASAVQRNGITTGK